MKIRKNRPMITIVINQFMYLFRMPLWNHYTKMMKKSPLADLNNISLSPGRRFNFHIKFERDMVK